MSRHHHRISLLALVVCAIAVAAYSSGTKWLWLGVAPSLHLGERRSPDAARRPTLEREALQVQHGHGDQGISGTLASHACPAGVGGDRRLCTGVGRGARDAPAAGRSDIFMRWGR
jgi:hypothetical protein